MIYINVVFFHFNLEIHFVFIFVFFSFSVGRKKFIWFDINSRIAGAFIGYPRPRSMVSEVVRDRNRSIFTTLDNMALDRREDFSHKSAITIREKCFMRWRAVIVPIHSAYNTKVKIFW